MHAERNAGKYANRARDVEVILQVVGQLFQQLRLNVTKNIIVALSCTFIPAGLHLAFCAPLFQTRQSLLAKNNYSRNSIRSIKSKLERSSSRKLSRSIGLLSVARLLRSSQRRPVSHDSAKRQQLHLAAVHSAHRRWQQGSGRLPHPTQWGPRHSHPLTIPHARVRPSQSRGIRQLCCSRRWSFRREQPLLQACIPASSLSNSAHAHSRMGSPGMCTSQRCPPTYPYNAPNASPVSR